LTLEWECRDELIEHEGDLGDLRRRRLEPEGTAGEPSTTAPVKIVVGRASRGRAEEESGQEAAEESRAEEGCEEGRQEDREEDRQEGQEGREERCSQGRTQGGPRQEVTRPASHSQLQQQPARSSPAAALLLRHQALPVIQPDRLQHRADRLVSMF
jgi:hypothetical protein